MHKDDNSKSIGIVGFAFALRKEDEPNPCNRRLAEEVVRLTKKYESVGYKVFIVVQWEIALALDELHFPFEHKVDDTPGIYLDSEKVMEEAAKIFETSGVNKVIPVANPFLHIVKCRILVRNYGFKLIREKIHHIGFDPKSDQWYTRNPFYLFLYTIRQVLTGRHG